VPHIEVFEITRLSYLPKFIGIMPCGGVPVHHNRAIFLMRFARMFTRRKVALGIFGVCVSGGAPALTARPQWRQVAAAYAGDQAASLPENNAMIFLPPEDWAARLIAAAEGQIGRTLSYDAAYSKIGYPNGDVPVQRGVCTDVVVRAYRQAFGIDLQKQVHEDMSANFAAYPQKWGLKRPDSNIDHRRVPNLQTFFKRQGASLPVSDVAGDYKPGDIVTMNLPGQLTHIALVTHLATRDGERPLCVHNIGAGARLEDTLFAFDLTGHYRYKPSARRA
jgi:uncharacterized protein